MLRGCPAEQMEKECAFALDLGVRSAPLPQEDDEQAGAPAAGGTTAGGDIPAGGMRRQRRRLAAAEEALLGSRGDAALVGPAGGDLQHVQAACPACDAQ